MRYLKRAVLPAVVILAVALLSGLPAAWARSVDTAGWTLCGVRGHSAPSPEMATVLSALGTQVGDGKLMDRTKEKLATLKNDDLRLIASLCERMPEGGGKAGSDFAFLLAAVLVVLS